MPTEVIPNESLQEESQSEETEEPQRRSLIRQSSFQRELADCIVRLDSIEDIKTILSCGANINEPITQGLTPLHYAVWQRHLEAAELLITEGCEINALDDIGYSPLHLSAEHGYTEMAELLIKQGSQINFLTSTEEYPMSTVEEPLRLALKNDHYKVAKLLLENGANPNTCYFFGYEINLVSPFNTQLINLLLTYGANVNARDRQSFSPLMKACRLQQGLESVLLLVSFGADVNLQADTRHDNRSMLHYAVLSGSIPIVNLLLKQGANINMDKDYGRPSPLDLAVLKGDVPLVKLLIESSADVNASSPILGTPLHLACSDGIKNRYDILQLLLESGADPNQIIYNEDNGPLRPILGEYLSSNEDLDPDVIKLFLKHGAEVIMQNQNRDHKGILRSFLEVTKNSKSLKELLEAAHDFDLPFIQRNMRIHDDQRELLLSVGQNALSLRHISRVFIRKKVGVIPPEKLNELDIPCSLKKYLIYEQR